ncbi:MAG: glutamate--tRNA ligase family protein, partial [Candidatus Levyibacteriota bacterium]
MNMVKVRFAPSPTGTLHVGGVRTALFNYCFAKARSGEFILRIEDTDQTRKVEGAVEQIKESLQWLGVSWDSLVTQSERVETYKKYAEELVEKGLARKEDGAVRFLVNKTGSTSWTDAVGNKKISFENNNVEDFIILKKDGFPTYLLANVIDD